MTSPSAPVAPPMPAPRTAWATRLGNTEFALNNILLQALLLMVAVFASQSPAFLSWSNAEVILTNNAAIGVLVAAMTLLVIAGHVDLSVGSNIALSSMVAALCATQWQTSAADGGHAGRRGHPAQRPVHSMA